MINPIAFRTLAVVLVAFYLITISGCSRNQSHVAYNLECVTKFGELSVRYSVIGYDVQTDNRFSETRYRNANGDRVILKDTKCLYFPVEATTNP